MKLLFFVVGWIKVSFYKLLKLVVCIIYVLNFLINDIKVYDFI